MTNRRSFILLAAAASTNPVMACAVARDNPATPDWFVINSCGGFDPDTDIRHGGAGGLASRPSIDCRRLNDALASGMRAANQTLGYVFGDREPFEQTVRDLGMWQVLIRNDPALVKIYTSADIERAVTERRLGVILGVQNAAMLGDVADRVDIFADLGLRIVQLTYNNQNALGSGCLVPEDQGLTPFGHAVVEKLNARQLIVDLSHSGPKSCLNAVRSSKQPVAITHTGCRALSDHPRNSTDEALRAVALKGGYVGMYFMPFLAWGRNARPADLLDHLEHAIDVCGEDHVGIGTDGGTSKVDIEEFKVVQAKSYAQRRAAGIAAPGESADTLTFIPELSGPDQFRALARYMAKRGHSSNRIEKVFGLNFLRFAREVWGA